jgi:1,4-alpha-glucan branching enzyme
VSAEPASVAPAHWHPPWADIEAIVEGRHGDPFAVLGMHRTNDGRLAVAAFLPDAEAVEVIESTGAGFTTRLPRVHDHGFFAGAVQGQEPYAYRLRIARGAEVCEADDPYRFDPWFGELDIHLLAEGRHRRLYEKLGAHTMTLEGVAGVGFAVWAPNASRVSVIGDFNRWDGRRHPMRKRHETGTWELFIPGLKRGALYKYELLDFRGRLLPSKADPFAFSQEMPPATASKVHALTRHAWHDQAWMAQRDVVQDRGAPISIYEVHLGSWRRAKHNAFFSYDRLAEELITYVKDLHFTHVELLPISEHPFTGSWGYQPIGLFAPSARFGPPDAFATFVERCHLAGVGVIIDWVPAHFPSDPHGLARFDGTALYEHEDPRLGFHTDWNTLIYNFGRNEIRNFLESNALFWLDQYHVDGLRVDAVASMLYLDYSRRPGEWIPNIHGGRENLEAIAFLRSANTNIYRDYKGAITIAEESTAWPQVSHPVDSGGLGFGYKWNMGWMHDTLAYMAHDPIHRRYHHDKLTFGLVYAFNENFVLPLSHDEVVHGKGSLLGKMPGDRWQKFANLRAYLAFMWTHPGKKLLFMGGEFAQEREWNHDYSLDWHLLADEMHRGVQSLVRDLNILYRSRPALHQLDCEHEGFTWIDGGNASESVLSFLRMGKDRANSVLVVCNLTPVVRRNYLIGAPVGGRWLERLNTDGACYGGSNVGNAGAATAINRPKHGQPYALELTLPPLATLVLEPEHANRGGGG